MVCVHDPSPPALRRAPKLAALEFKNPGLCRGLALFRLLEIRAKTEGQGSLIGRPEVASIGRPFHFPQDLATVPIVLPGRGEGIRTAFDRLLEEAGVTPIILAEVDDMAMLRLIARESHSLTLAPPVVVIEELTSGALVEHSRLPNIKEAFYVITRRRRFENPLLRELTAKRV